MTNCIETIKCGPSATGDDILFEESAKKLPVKLIKLSELLQSGIITEVKSVITEQKDLVTADQIVGNFQIETKVYDVPYAELDSKLISDIKGSLNAGFFVGCYKAFKSNFSFKVLVSFIIGILGGFDLFLKSYFVIAIIAIWFGVWADFKYKRLTFKGFIKKINFQLALLAFIAVGSMLTNIIALTICNQLMGWRLVILPICTLTNVAYFLVSAKEVGIYVPDSWVNSVSWIKKFLA